MGGRESAGGTEQDEPAAGAPATPPLEQLQVTGEPPAPDEGAELAPGLLLEKRYQIERPLARGGMGAVYTARDLRLRRLVAVKVLKSRAPDERALRRFEQEAHAAGALNHPNVVAVLDAGLHDGRPFLVTELLQGKTLREALDAGQSSPAAAARLCAQVARGLAAAHGAGIVHRDLKPENVFLTEEGFAKILDFGIAKLARPTAPDHQTEPGQVVGTVRYMSPEQVREGPVDARSDLFALGVVLCELLSGRHPFERPTRVGTAYAILREEPAPLPPSVPEALRAVALRCLAKEPDKRFASARELAEALEKILEEPPAPASRPRSWPRSWPRWIALPLALVAALLATVAFCGRDRFRFAPPVRGRVVVFPFELRGDQRYAYFGEGMMDMLTGGLDVSGVKPVDVASVLQFVRKSGARVDADLAKSAARRFGAQLYILGSVVEMKDQLHLSATLYSLDAEAALETAVAVGSAERIFALTEELAVPLRMRIAGESLPREGPAGRFGRLARESTSSAEALKYYLEGEATLRRGDWKDAIELFRRAVVADPRFTIAQYRLAVAAAGREPGLADDALAIALRDGERLSAHDRALVEAFAAQRAGRAAEAESRYRALLRETPDNVDAWFELGETLFHQNPLRGRPAYEASEAFARVLALDPEHGGALAHLIFAALLQGQRKAAESLAERFLASSAEGRDSALAMRWVRAWAAGDGEARRSALERLVAPGAPLQDQQEALLDALWDPATIGDARVIGQAISAQPDPRYSARGWEALAAVELVVGRFREARLALERARARRPGEPPSIDALYAGTLPFVPASREQLDSDLAQAALARPGAPHEQWKLGYVKGALALRAGRVEEARKQADELAALVVPDDSTAADLALALRAQLAWQAGRPREARAHLAEQELRVPTRHRDRDLWSYYAAQPLLRAELAQAEGKDEEALRWLSSFALPAPFEPIRRAPAELQLARLHDRRQEPAEAVKHYQRFVDLWQSADAEVQPQVEDARRRIAALSGQAAKAAAPR